jgi:uncharacterized protein (DUF924 family)
MIEPEQVLSFWLDELTPKDWYNGGDELDRQIKEKFEAGWQMAADGSFGLWLTYPSGVLAYLILTDQMPRNMFRGQGMAFQTDRFALAAAKIAISRGWDMRIDAPARQFFYLPLMHSECLCDQDRCVRLIKERMPNSGDDNLIHAKVHREIIRKFGRFPYRNEALERETTPSEQAFLENGGYRQIMIELQEKVAA